MSTVIEYTEMSQVFLGIGGMVLLFALAWGFFHIMRVFQQLADKEDVYNKTEIAALDEMVQRKKPLIHAHAKLLDALKRKEFRKRLEEELVDDFFKERESKKEKA